MTPCYESEDGDDRDRSEVHVTDGSGRIGSVRNVVFHDGMGGSE